MNNVDAIFIVLRLMAATALFMLVVVGGFIFWARRRNNLVRFGGLGLVILALRNLVQAVITAWWAYTVEVAVPERVRTFLATSNALALVEHIALIMLLLILLGYIPVREGVSEQRHAKEE